MTGATWTKRVLVAIAVGGALCVAAAGPAGAATVGLLKASQLPGGYQEVGKPITLSGSTILKSTKSLGGGLGGATTSCKGAPTAASLKGYTAHIAAFEKGASASALGILGEVVLQAPSASAASSYLSAAKAATASCKGNQTITTSGVTVKVTYTSHNTTIGKAGADAAVGTFVSLTAKSSVKGATITVKGSLGLQTYRKGADLVEVFVENLGIKADESTGSGTVTFSPGSSSLVSSVGKAAISDL